MQVSLSSGPIGAEITGVNLGDLDAAGFDALAGVFLDRGVIVVRDQRLSSQALVALTRRFGTPEVIPILRQYQKPGLPEVLTLSNILGADGQPIGLPDGGQTWHSDGQTAEVPQSLAILHAHEVPVGPDGTALGDTLFASTAAAHDALPDALRARIAGRRAIQRYSRYDAPQDGRRAELDTVQRQLVRDRLHPAVRTHPRTGRKCLYVSPYFTRAIEGLDAAESDALLAAIFAHQTERRFVHRHRWRVGDVLIWDQCATIHKAVADYALPQRRLMERTCVAGTVPA